MGGDNKGQGTIKADETLFAIVERLEQRGSAGVTELANEVGLAKSSIHKHLKTLQQHGYVVREADAYRLSFRFLTIGGTVRNGNRLCRTASLHVERLANETNRLSAFAVKEGDHGVFTHVYNDRYGITDDNPLGQTFHLHQNAAGKAMLAQLSDEEIDQVIQRQGLPSKTRNTIVDRVTLFEEIEDARNRGFAISVQERVEGVDAISASVHDPEIGTLGAISITAPGDQMTKNAIKETYADLVVETAKELELQSRYR